MVTKAGREGEKRKKPTIKMTNHMSKLAILRGWG